MDSKKLESTSLDKAKIELALDSTQLMEYSHCPRAWYYRFVERLEKADRKRDALDWGSLMHALLETYYNMRALNPSSDPHEAATEAMKMVEDTRAWSKMGLKSEDWVFIKTRFLQYIFNQRNGDFRPIINKSGVPAIEIGFSKTLYEDATHHFALEGRIDLIAEIDRVFFVDHKTQGQAKELYEFKLQFVVYSWATGLKWGLVNYIGFQKELTNKSFRRHLFEVPDHVREGMLTRIRHFCFEISRQLPFGEAHFDQHWDSCAGAYESTPCQYTPICTTKDPGMKESIKKFQFVQIEEWKPWK